MVLRRWGPADAQALLPVLEANVTHLQQWIPRHVASPAPTDALSRRLADFATAFEENREWRYGLFATSDRRVLGEVSLFPRGAAGRAPFGEADHLEIGYWIREDATGQGLATEAAQAMIELGSRLPGMRRIEIRCDALNAASAAVPKRLGFHLADTIEDEGVGPVPDRVQLQIWALAIESRGDVPSRADLVDRSSSASYPDSTS